MQHTFDNIINAIRGGAGSLFLVGANYIDPLDLDKLKEHSSDIKAFRFELLDNNGALRIMTLEEWDYYLEAAAPTQEEDEPVKEAAAPVLMQPEDLITPLRPTLKIKKLAIDDSAEDEEFIITYGYNDNDGVFHHHTAADIMAWSK